MLIDSHVHLQDKKFARDLDRVIERAEDAGVERLICVGDKLESSRTAIALARRQPRLTAAVGVHPNHDKQFSPMMLLELEKLSRDPTVVAVGEIGLDYHYPNYDADKQMQCFVAQAHLAHRNDLPVAIHCRSAYDELLDAIRTDAKIPREGVIHCFSGTYEQACAFLDLGYYLGIGGAITYPNGDPLRETIRRLGLDRVVIETDAPYLPPQAKRGRRNEPSYLKHTLKAIADLTGLRYQDAARLTKTNTIKLFQLPAPIRSEMTYSIRQTLYICVTNRCPNDCYFCQRCGDYMVMGHLLKLDREPTADELLARIEDPTAWHEIVLSGLGEPTMRWDVCLDVARKLKDAGARVTLNTSGLGSLLNERNIVPDMTGIMDGVSINLIAHDKTTYNAIAKPQKPEHAWEAMLDFARECKKGVPDVTLSVVAVPEVDVEACRKLAEDDLQVRFRVREYRPNGYTIGDCQGQ